MLFPSEFVLEDSQKLLPGIYLVDGKPIETGATTVRELKLKTRGKEVRGCNIFARIANGDLEVSISRDGQNTLA